MKILIIFCLFSIITANEFFNVNRFHNTELSKCVDCSYGPIQLAKKFNVLNNIFDNIFIHSDGFISLDQCDNIIDCDNYISIYHTNTSLCGNIYFDEIKKFYYTNQFATLIKNNFDNNFETKFAYLISWYNMKTNVYDITHRNTFQLVLLTNNVEYYIIFNYFKLEFKLNQTFIRIKISNNEYESRISEDEMYQTSNVNKTGLWVFNANEKKQLEKYFKILNNSSQFKQNKKFFLYFIIFYLIIFI